MECETDLRTVGEDVVTKLVVPAKAALLQKTAAGRILEVIVSTISTHPTTLPSLRDLGTLDASAIRTLSQPQPSTSRTFHGLSRLERGGRIHSNHASAVALFMPRASKNEDERGPDHVGSPFGQTIVFGFESNVLEAAGEVVEDLELRVCAEHQVARLGAALELPVVAADFA
jgi:hypothetical protein